LINRVIINKTIQALIYKEIDEDDKVNKNNNENKNSN
jgi:hypothetical protein